MISLDPNSHLCSCSDTAIERSAEVQEENFRMVMKIKELKCRVRLMASCKESRKREGQEMGLRSLVTP